MYVAVSVYAPLGVLTFVVTPTSVINLLAFYIESVVYYFKLRKS